MKKHLKLVLSLRDEPFFRSMSDALLTRIESYVFHREYEPKQIVFFPDDPLDFVYWVREGRIKVTRIFADRRELTFRHLLSGDMLGEECLVDRRRRGAYAEAMTASVLCLMRADDFRRIAREEAEVSLKVAQRLAQRITEAEDVLAETVFNPVRRRVASGLLRLYRRASEHERGTLHVTHQEVANLIGSTRETTTAVLHEFREDGILVMSNRRLTIVDPVALEHLAGVR